MKTGKEIKTNIFKNYNIVFGSVNNKNPKALYVNISAWAEPKNADEVNYTRAIKNINKKLKQLLYNTFDNPENNLFLKDRTIVDLDIRESGIRYGKRSFMSCELTLFSDLEIPVNTEFMKFKIHEIINSVTKKVFDCNDYFDFHKKKK
jgi:hypothetical protein